MTYFIKKFLTIYDKDLSFYLMTYEISRPKIEKVDERFSIQKYFIVGNNFNIKNIKTFTRYACNFIIVFGKSIFKKYLKTKYRD